MRPGVDTITPPPFPRELRWVNAAPLRMDQQRGRPVLVEFWDMCRVSSLRTLPYLQGWHQRYAEAGLRVISVHAPGFDPGHDEDVVRDAVSRLGITHPVCLDTDLELWSLYDNEGWPARYLFGAHGTLVDYHLGEGAYADTERAIQRELGTDRPPLAPVRPTDDPAALIVVPTPDQPGAYDGPYEAGEVWIVVSGPGTVVVNGHAQRLDHPGAHRVVVHERHTTAVLELQVGDAPHVYATCFTAGLAP